MSNSNKFHPLDGNRNECNECNEYVFFFLSGGRTHKHIHTQKHTIKYENNRTRIRKKEEPELTKKKELEERETAQKCRSKREKKS